MTGQALGRNGSSPVCMYSPSIYEVNVPEGNASVSSPIATHFHPDRRNLDVKGCQCTQFIN
jgi:hypothetical protein